MTDQMITRIAFFMILALYGFLGVQYATQTPDWQVPDEPAHYNYIRQIAEDGIIPEIVDGDWDTDYQNLLVSSGFNPANTTEIARVEYEDHQPPLYYLISAPIYALADGSLIALRIFAVLIGMGILIAAFLAIRILFPESPWLALGTIGFIAFIPQNLAMLGGVNNDGLAQLWAAIVFWRVALYLTTEEPITTRDNIILGIAVGLAFLTKSTVYYIAGIAGIAILLRWRRDGWQREIGVRHLAAFLIPALLLGGLWWGRNLIVYDGTDFLGLQRHDEVAAGQLKTDDYINTILNGDAAEYRKNYAYTTFHSFWGQFGWMGVPMPTRIYRILAFGCLLALTGVGLFMWRQSFSTAQKEWLGLGSLAIVFVFAAYFLYNLQFVQFQGRYLFTGLLPLGVIFSFGIMGWAQWITPRVPLAKWTPVIVILIMAGFAWYALQTYIVGVLPTWH